MIRKTKIIIGKLFPKIKYQHQFIPAWSRANPETELIPQFCRRGSVALDIGANQGGYVWYLKQIAGEVVAFEPLPSMQRVLKRIYGRKIRTEGVVLSDSEGQVQMRYPAEDLERATIASLNQLSDQNDVRSITVQARTLDSYGFHDISFVKIDVEGHEEAVLRGGIETIKRELPNIFIEIEERHCPGSINRVSSLLKDIGYSGHYLELGKITPIENFVLERDQPTDGGKIIGRYINNFIFLHP